MADQQQVLQQPSGSSNDTSIATSPPIPDNLNQAIVTANAQLHRFQQDLLILTSLDELSTLHWRPTWFAKQPLNSGFWTLYNPPNVVTDLLPGSVPGERAVTRRMRPKDGRPAPYIKDWVSWYRYCDRFGIPRDFLCEKQITLMRLGLPRDRNGDLCPPPQRPLYPEPHPTFVYILHPDTYITLPEKFQFLNPSYPLLYHTYDYGTEEGNNQRLVVVCTDGALMIARRGDLDFSVFYSWNIAGNGVITLENRLDWGWDEVTQSKGRRWAYLPWTKEMEESCVTSRIAEAADEGNLVGESADQPMPTMTQTQKQTREDTTTRKGTQKSTQLPTVYEIEESPPASPARTTQPKKDKGKGIARVPPTAPERGESSRAGAARAQQTRETEQASKQSRKPPTMDKGSTNLSASDTVALIRSERARYYHNKHVEASIAAANAWIQSQASQQNASLDPKQNAHAASIDKDPEKIPQLTAHIERRIVDVEREWDIPESKPRGMFKPPPTLLLYREIVEHEREADDPRAGTEVRVIALCGPRGRVRYVTWDMYAGEMEFEPQAGDGWEELLSGAVDMAVAKCRSAKDRGRERDVRKKGKERTAEAGEGVEEENEATRDGQEGDQAGLRRSNRVRFATEKVGK